MWVLRITVAAVAAGQRRPHPSAMNSFAQVVEAVAAVMVVSVVVEVEAAVAVSVFDLFWEILGLFAPGSVILCGSSASHRSGTWVPDILSKD